MLVPKRGHNEIIFLKKVQRIDDYKLGIDLETLTPHPLRKNQKKKKRELNYLTLLHKSNHPMPIRIYLLMEIAKISNFHLCGQRSRIHLPLLTYMCKSSINLCKHMFLGLISINLDCDIFIYREHSIHILMMCA